MPNTWITRIEIIKHTGSHWSYYLKSLWFKVTNLFTKCEKRKLTVQGTKVRFLHHAALKLTHVMNKPYLKGEASNIHLYSTSKQEIYCRSIDITRFLNVPENFIIISKNEKYYNSCHYYLIYTSVQILFSINTNLNYSSYQTHNYSDYQACFQMILVTICCTSENYMKYK